MHLGGVACAALAGWLLYAAEHEQIAASFAQELARDGQLVAQALVRIEDRLWATQAMFRQSEFVDIDEFPMFAAVMCAEQPWLRAIEWCPSVPEPFVADHERVGRQMHGGGYRLRSSRAQLDRGEHYSPTLYVHPRRGNEHRLGRDAGDSPQRRAMLAAATSANRIAVGVADVADRQVTHELAVRAQTGGAPGHVVFLVDLRLLLSSLLTDQTAREVSLSLWDRGDGGGAVEVAFGGATSHAERALPGQPGSFDCALELGDRPLVLVSRPSSAAWAARRSATPWSGAGAVLLGASGLLHWRRRQRRMAAAVEAEVVARTRELAAANDRLARSEAKAQAFFQLGLVGLAELEIDGRIRRCNAEFAAMAGLPARELAGRRYADLLAEPGRTEVAASLVALRRGELERHTAMLDMVASDRRSVPVSMGLRANRAPEGEVDGLLLVQVDMRDIVRVLDELRSAKQLADAANLAKSQFLANMSHEIRTPMTAILGYTRLLLEQATDGEAKEALGIVSRNGEHLMTVLNDILDLSKIEAGRLQVSPEPFALRELLGEVITLLQPRAAAKGLALELRSDGPVPATVCSDATRLRQILFNLLGNAIKFTERGAVSLRVSVQPNRTRPALQLDVVDTGIGMDERQIAGLFQPFGQVDVSNTRRFGGTGLGLAISRRLARMLGGDLVVQSAVGAGSTFRVTIDPGQVDDSQTLGLIAAMRPPSPPPEPPARASRRGNVLVADDGVDNRRLLRAILERAGHTVTLAEDGAQACEAVAAAQPPFDVIVMDMQMPVLDGYDAVRRLREQGLRTPILACTARAMSDDRARCLAAGCDDYVSKPIDSRALLARIDAALAAR